MDVKDMTVSTSEIDKVRESVSATRTVYLTHAELYALRDLVDSQLDKDGDYDDLYKNILIKLYSA